MPLNHCHPGPVLWLIPFIWPWKLQIARSKRSKPTLSKMHIASLAVFGTVVRATYPDFICPCLSFGCCVFQCAPLSSRNPSAACTEESSPPLGHMGQDKFTHIREHVEINICSIACRSPAFCKLLPGWCSLGLKHRKNARMTEIQKPLYYPQLHCNDNQMHATTLLNCSCTMVRTIHYIILATCGGHARTTFFMYTNVDKIFLLAPLAPMEIMAPVIGALFQAPPPRFWGGCHDYPPLLKRNTDFPRPHMQLKPRALRFRGLFATTDVGRVTQDPCGPRVLGFIQMGQL